MEIVNKIRGGEPSKKNEQNGLEDSMRAITICIMVVQIGIRNEKSFPYERKINLCTVNMVSDLEVQKSN